MSNAFFTSHDGTIWISKSHMRKIITDTLDALPSRSEFQIFSDILTGYLDACYAKEEKPNINNPDMNWFYCGSCHYHFQGKSYKKDDIQTDWIPCPRCGSQSARTE